MKTLRILFIAVLIVIIGDTNANARSIYRKEAEYTEGRLSLVSYSTFWSERDLKDLYQELISNTTGPEFSYLRAVYIYPDSPYGISGAYFEDIKESDKGRFLLGTNSYIELYNGNTKTTIEEMAPVLSHEYGHHFTIFNMMIYENNHYKNWKNSRYAQLRNLAAYPVIYDKTTSCEYSSIWDIAEIAANDYVQLLGSDLAKKSYRYLDARQFVELADEGVKYLSWHFNSKPQENMDLPLAAQIPGLYEYFLEISDNQDLALEKIPHIKKLPEITALVEKKAFINKSYTITFSNAIGNGPFEYTVLLYPKEFINIPAALKTLNDDQPLEATFGTLLREVDSGKFMSVLDYYGGLCELRIFVKDIHGFIYSSEPFFHDFGDDFFDVKNYVT